MSFPCRMVLCVWFGLMAIGCGSVSLDMALLASDTLSRVFFVGVGGSLTYACYLAAMRVFP